MNSFGSRVRQCSSEGIALASVVGFFSLIRGDGFVLSDGLFGILLRHCLVRRTMLYAS
ncbi:MAG: hypothetical protein V3V14_11895 [Saprospiraceae bacterium]